MLFSILIANYNNGKYFKDCYDSIIAQSYSNWEVIIVDDKSTDNSIEQIREIIIGDDRFKLYENEKNEGCGFTKRRCAELANGKFAGFLDPDDSLTPDALYEMNKSMSEHKDACLIHSSLFFCNERLEVGSKYEWAKSVITDSQFTNLDYAVTAFSAFSLESYRQTEGIDPSLKSAVDQDLYLKLSEVGTFYFLNKPLYNYRLHSNGITSSNGGPSFYNHLKVIVAAEKRRNVNLTNMVNNYFGNKSIFLFDAKLNNPRYLFKKLLYSLRKNPKMIFKKIS